MLATMILVKVSKESWEHMRHLKQNNYRWSNSTTADIDMEKVYETFVKRNPQVFGLF